MAEKRTECMILSLLLTILQLTTLSNSIPLSTHSRWIVDQSGNRVKLACANWASHMDPMLPEGLEKKPVSYIAGMLSKTGFNCVRFTWPTFMFTRPEYGNLIVSHSLDKFQLQDAKAGFARNNPNLFNVTVRDVQKAVVDELGRNKIMVVLDNTVSIPKWCCSNDDGNGFFGDEYFDPKEWLQGLTTVARIYNGHPAVIGMSLRNELRGKRQNEKDWYNFMAQGATAVHRESPDFLVIVSGLAYDTDLNFLNSKPLGLDNLDNKLVYEAHWYGFYLSSEEWTSKTNTLCAKVSGEAEASFIFVVAGDNRVPLFLSEFGIDQRGVNEGENRYISCILAKMVEFDMDWALWTFHGSYMLREGVPNMEEVYGVMDKNWNGPRNQSFLLSLQIVQMVNQVPVSAGPVYCRMFHPQSGQCVLVSRQHIFLGHCDTASLWESHVDGDTIRLAHSPFCLAATGDGAPVILARDCGSRWKYASISLLHLATKDVQGRNLCLEKNASGSGILTRKCRCLRDDDLSDFPTCSDNPQVQWFRLVPTNALGNLNDTFPEK